MLVRCLVICVVLAAMVGCSATAGEGTRAPDSTAEAASSIVSTTITAEVEPLFAVSSAEVEAVVAERSSFGIAVNDAFNDPDASAFVSLFQQGAYFTDPVNPSMRPDVAFMHELYGGGEVGSLALAEAHPTRALPHGAWDLDLALGNQHGAATVGSIQVSDPPGSLRVIRQLPVSEGKAERGQHYFEIEMLRSFPDEIAAVLYLSPADVERVTAQVAIADEFMAAYESAWATRDLETIARLYDRDASRSDYLIGSPSGDSLIDWIRRLLDQHPGFGIVIDAAYASNGGPAALVQWQDVAGEALCSMTVVTIWDLDPDGLITHESIYYDPTDVLECGWDS